MSARPSSHQAIGYFKKGAQAENLSNQPINIPMKLRDAIRSKCRPFHQQKSAVSFLKKCSICREEWPYTEVEELECGHVFCYQCLHNYIIFRLIARMEMACPCCPKILRNELECWQRCPTHLEERVLSLEKKIGNAEKKGIKSPTQKDPKSKFRLCSQEKCKGVVDLSAAKFQCSIQDCKKEYCQKCYLPKHDETLVNCVQAYLTLAGNRLIFKRCPHCNQFRQPKEMCTHFSCQMSHEVCLVCITGWSDKFTHQCKEFDPLPDNIWLKQSIMNSSRCLNILRGSFLVIFFPIYFVLLVALIIVGHAVVAVVTVVVAPFAVVAQLCEDQKLLVVLFFICFPCGELVGIAFTAQKMWEEYTSSLPPYLITYLLTTKSLLFYTHPYRQDHSLYTPIAISSTCQKLVYVILMIVILPFVLLLVPLFFLVGITIVFIFTLLSLPVIASEQKGIPVWVSIIFFPIVFLNFIAVDYSRFFKSLLVEMCSFYKIYCETLCRYLTCQDPIQEDTACVNPLPKQSVQ